MKLYLGGGPDGGGARVSMLAEGGGSIVNSGIVLVLKCTMSEGIKYQTGYQLWLQGGVWSDGCDFQVGADTALTTPYVTLMSETNVHSI